MLVYISYTVYNDSAEPMEALKHYRLFFVQRLLFKFINIQNRTMGVKLHYLRFPGEHKGFSMPLCE